MLFKSSFVSNWWCRTQQTFLDPNQNPLSWMLILDRFACESCVVNKRVWTSDGNVECCQRSVTGEAAFPYGTTNTQRQADTLEQLSSSSSSSHHHERTICSEQKHWFRSGFAYLDSMQMNDEGDTFRILLGSVRLVFGCNQTVCSCKRSRMSSRPCPGYHRKLGSVRLTSPLMRNCNRQWGCNRSV